MSDNEKKEKLSLSDLTTQHIKNTEESIAEMENILSLMDEIDMMKKNSNADKEELLRLKNTVGGYSRVEIAGIIDELKSKRDNTITDIEKENNSLLSENKNLKSEMSQIKDDVSKLTRLFTKQVELNKLDSKADILDAKQDKQIFDKMQNEIAKLKNEIKSAREETPSVANEVKMLKSGDNTLMIESIYNGLSAEIESFKKYVSDEIKYSYTQKLAIYEDLSQQIANLDGLEIKNFEEKLTELSQLKSTDIKILEDKIENFCLSFNAETISEMISDKISEKVTNNLMNFMPEKNQTENYLEKVMDKLSEKDNEIKNLTDLIGELKNKISSLAQPKSNSEFSLIDYEINEYKVNSTKSILKDLLIEARNLKNKALKYFENGNNILCDEIIEGLKSRLKTTYISSSAEIGDLAEISENYNIPSIINKAKLINLKNVLFKYEQGSIIPDVQIINDIIRTKKITFDNSELTLKDKRTFDTLKEESENVNSVSELTSDKIKTLKNLKKELLSFSLECVFDFAIKRMGGEISDTDLLLAEIKSLKNEIKSTNQKESCDCEYSDITSLTDELDELAKIATEPLPEKPKKTRGKAKKILRPSLPDKNAKALKPDGLKKSQINLNTNQNPQALSNIVGKKIAENISNKKPKK